MIEAAVAARWPLWHNLRHNWPARREGL